MLSTGSSNLNDVVSEIADLLSDHNAYLRIEYIVSLIRQVEGVRINVGPKRAALQPAQLRHQLLLNLLESCAESSEGGEDVVRLAEALSALSRQDIESVFEELVECLATIEELHLARYATALVALCKKLHHIKLPKLIQSLDSIIWSDSHTIPGKISAFNELASMTRFSLRQDYKLRHELMKRCRLGSPFSILVMCGVTTGALKSALDQIEADKRFLSLSGHEPSFILDARNLIDKVCLFVDENDEAGILLLIEAINQCTCFDFKKTAYKRLLQKRLAKETVLEKILWPVHQDQHLVASELEAEMMQTIVDKNARLLVEIGRQDCLLVVCNHLLHDRLGSLLDDHVGRLTDYRPFLALLAKNEDSITAKVVDHLQYIDETSEFLCQLIVQRVQNMSFAKILLELFFEESGKDCPEKISWINLCSFSSLHPYLIIGFCMVQEEQCDERLGDIMKIVCET